MTMAGSIFGWKMTFLVFVSVLVMTPALPTSEPVPAVVGTATMGAMASAFARFHQSPTSSKSHIGRVWPAMKATHLPTSSALPPPNATTPSWPPALKASTPASTLASIGLALTSLKKPAPGNSARASLVIGRSARPVSVTNSGFLMPATSAARGSSLMRPGPKRTVVG
jgi:hypothetical protein